MKTIDLKSDLEKLYKGLGKAIEGEINDLILKYENHIQLKSYELSEKDIVLITYADTLTRKGEKPLQTLHSFLNDNLKGLINSVHILPFYPFTSDDGFSVKDYYQVNPDFGSWDDIVHLSQEYRLMFDAVVNHASKAGLWFQEFLKGNPEYSNFFVEVNPNDKRLNKVFRPRALPLVHEYQYSGKKKYVWTTFSEDQVDLNYANPKVFLAILDLLLFYISKGARLIRLDAVGFLWKKLGTSCIHLPETHLIIQLYRKIIESLASDVFIITETNVPHKDNISYFGNGNNEAHMVYNFSLPPLLAYSVISGNVKPLKTWLQNLDIPKGKACYFNFTASHDGIGLQPVKGILQDSDLKTFEEQVKKNNGYVSYKNNSDGSKSPYELNCSYLNLVSLPEDADSLKVKKFILTQAVMLTLPGVPGIYIHSMLGTENDIKAAQESGIPRRINRSHLKYNQILTRLNDEKTLQGIIFNTYKKLLKIRTREPFFNPFVSFDVQLNSESVLNIHKSINENDFWALFNFSPFSKSVKLDTNRKIFNLLNFKELKNNEIELPPFDFVWLKAEK